MKYIKLFETLAALNAFKKTEDFLTPNVSLAEDTPDIMYYEPYVAPVHDYSQDYFTIVSLADNNTIGFNISSSYIIYVSTDNGTTWTQPNDYSALATLNNGDKLLIKCNATGYGSGSFTSTGNFNVEGNIMSLLYGDNFANQTSFDTSNNALYQFKELFKNCTYLVSAEHLILPVLTLTSGCYYGMFSACTSLTTTPELPATTLAVDCYNTMFYHCTSLTTAPSILPATTLVDGCYNQMFFECSLLTTAPELPATTLVSQCYNMMLMFTSVNYVKCLAINIPDNSCTNMWLYSTPASGTFIKNASMSSWGTGTSGIPEGWTVQDAA